MKGQHCPAHGHNSPHVETRHGWKCLRCIHERRKKREGKVLQAEFLSARGTKLTARRAEDNIIFLYRGRELACLPAEALLRRKAGLHLTRDEDPAFWLDYEALSLVITVL